MPKNPTRRAAALVDTIARGIRGSGVPTAITQETRPSKGRIMYIERKAGSLTGEARIGRVTFSKSGRTLYYRGHTFQSLKGAGFKSNYFDVDSGEDYWISGPRKDGADRLYGERVPVDIDEDVREEYWCNIRGRPERKSDAKA